MFVGDPKTNPRKLTRVGYTLTADEKKNLIKRAAYILQMTRHMNVVIFKEEQEDLYIKLLG